MIQMRSVIPSGMGKPVLHHICAPCGKARDAGREVKPPDTDERLVKPERAYLGQPRLEPRQPILQRAGIIQTEAETILHPQPRRLPRPH